MQAFVERLKASPVFKELVGLLALALALVCMLALLSYDGADATWFQHREPGARASTQNWIGMLGANLSEALLQLFGLTALLVPVIIGCLGWRALRARYGPAGSLRLPLGLLGLVFALDSLLDLLYGPIVYRSGLFLHPGGLAGERLAALLRGILNTPGAVIVAATSVAVLVIVSTRASLVRTAELCYGGLRALAASAREQWRARPSRSPSRRASAPVAKRPVDEPSASERRPTIALPASAPPTGKVGQVADEVPAEDSAKPAHRRKPAAPRPPRQVELPIEKGARAYSLPPLELLNEPGAQERESEEDLLERARHITDKFREFSINGTVVAIHPGPVVTTFEFKPEAGVKYSRITGMTDDLSLALRAESVRIDRLAGRSTVGIEVPNRRQETIYPRELIGSQAFAEARSKLSLALGKDIHGEVHVAELERMPHLLIAGATGAGKSVGLNGMIVSLIYKATPRDLRFIMIDTKMIELGVYAGIPHLLVPVVTDPKHASAALQWAVREMETRYRKLASVGMRNLAQFNALLAEEPDRTMDDPRGGDPIPLSHLPYIVIVIDEMADLMMVSPADVEESVMRLAQMARAVGIHLILATQRPSVDVITGTIKANFPSRIAFRVSQRVDSRTIIDQQGAEHLLGRGDMLLLPTGTSRVIRLHSGFITEPEINRITSYLKRMAAPEYDPTVIEDPGETRTRGEGGDRDEMFGEAVRTVIQEGKCSITLIQRRLQLGYARAARIVDMMEQEGVVSAGEGAKPREVLVGPDFLETLETGYRG